VSAIVYYAVLAASICVATAQPAYAYLDPGTGSIILQSVIGAIAAGLIIGRGYFDRIKAWFSSTRTAGAKGDQRPSE
jgi:hypothetical protein